MKLNPNPNYKHFFSSLFFLFIVTFLFNGCKKADDETINANVVNPQIEGFLKIPVNSTEELKLVTADLLKQLINKNFVNDFIQWHGKPDWEKAIKIKTYDTSVVLLIPTYRDNEILTFIGVKYSNGNFKYELHRKSSVVNKRKEYSYIGFNENTNKWFLNYFNQETAKSKTNNSAFENLASPPFCWYRLIKVPCNLQENNLESTVEQAPCYGWLEQCSDDDGNGGPWGGSGGGGCTTCYPPECPAEVWYNIVPDPQCENIPLSPTVIYLNSLFNFSPERLAWLNAHQYEASVIKQMLDSNKIQIEGEEPMIVYDPKAMIAARVTIDGMMGNYINGPYNTAHYNHIKHNIPGYENHPTIDPAFWVHFRVRCALTKLEHPEWSYIKVYFTVMLEIAQLGLDLIGLIPVIGEVADLVNGAIYTIQGDGLNATLSFASTIPVAGWFAAGVKFATRADGLKFLVKGVNNIIEFGAYNSKKFRQSLGLPLGDLRQAHHLIPRANNIVEHRVVQKAAKATVNQGFHIDQVLNGIPVAPWRNQPNHFAYNNRVFVRLNNISDNLSANETYIQLQSLMQEIRTLVINNPNVHLNDLVF